jgi:hypothetical protein
VAHLSIDENNTQAYWNPDIKEEELHLQVKIKCIKKSVKNTDEHGIEFSREADLIFLIPQDNLHLERFYAGWFPRNTASIEAEMLFINSKSGRAFRVYLSLPTKDCQERHLGLMSMDDFPFFIKRNGEKLDIISVKNSDEHSGKYGDI